MSHLEITLIATSFSFIFVKKFWWAMSHSILNFLSFSGCCSPESWGYHDDGLAKYISDICCILSAQIRCHCMINPMHCHLIQNQKNSTLHFALEVSLLFFFSQWTCIGSKKLKCHGAMTTWHLELCWVINCVTAICRVHNRAAVQREEGTTDSLYHNDSTLPP